MAFSITELANYSENNSAATSKTTGSLSIPANSVILVFGHGAFPVNAWDASHAMSVSDSTNGTSGWAIQDSQVNLPNSFSSGGGALYARSFTSSTSVTITITRSGGGTTYWGYSVIAVTGQNTSTPIVQAKGAGTYFGGGNNNSQATTFSSAPTSGNAVITFLGVNNDGTAAATAPSSFTAVDLPSVTNNEFELTSVARSTSTTSTTITWPDCGGGSNSATTAWFTA
jgi:hypothetical protein